MATPHSATHTSTSKRKETTGQCGISLIRGINNQSICPAHPKIANFRRLQKARDFDQRRGIKKKKKQKLRRNKKKECMCPSPRQM